MPLAPKHKLHNPFHCPSCPRVFETRSGLSQHYRKKHRKASSPLTDHCDADLSNKNVIPLLPDTVRILPDIGQIVRCCPEVIIEPSSPESETRRVSNIIPVTSNISEFSTNSLHSVSLTQDTSPQVANQEFQFGEGLPRLPDDNELYTDGNTDTEDSDLDI